MGDGLERAGEVAGEPGRLTIGVDASRAFGARQTGTERYATALIEALAARRRHDLRVYVRAAPTRVPAGIGEVKVLRAPRLWTHTRLAAEVWRDPPDVLFVPAHVLPVGVRCPAVVTVHDLGYIAFPDAHTFFQRRYLDWSTRHHCAVATRIIADSRATRDDLVRHYGAKPERIDVVHLGVDASMTPATDAQVDAARRRAGLPDGARYVLHVGTLQPRKNVARLVEAFSLVATRVPDAALLLAGMPGWGREDLPRLASRLGVRNRVHFAGYVPHGDLPALYTGADVLAFPSLYEGFGLPVLEAMACGTAVAASNTSSLPEVVGDAGVLFDPGDPSAIAAALYGLLEDEARRRETVSRGLRWVRQFTWARCARETEAVLERAAERRG